MSFKRKIYFIQEHLQEEYYHGGIGNTDVEKVLLRENAIPIAFPFHYDFSVKAKWLRLMHLFRVWRSLEPGSVVVFQHPLYAGMNKLLVRLLRSRKKINVVCLAAEINGLKYDDDNILQKEKKYFRHIRYFIVHNASMQNWLTMHVPGRTSAILNFFDFLATPVLEESLQKREMSFTIAYAGNLEEGSFLEKLPQITTPSGKLTINLYGKPKPAGVQFSDRLVYKGFFEPYALPSLIEGAFGLVWDGNETDTIQGSFGHYMQYISHHKVSLYILSGMPLIVYENAGTAALVKQYAIGFTIRSLAEIEGKIAGLTETAWRQMCNNTRELAKQISSGACLTNALREIITAIDKNENTNR
jgi:hypothetical protein